MKKKSVMIFASMLIGTPYAMAAEFPTQVYDATYQTSSAQGKTATRMASDGKGHFLTQTSAGGQKYTTIIDYINGTSTSLIPQGKMAMKTKLPPNGGFVADESSAKKLGGKLIGSKVVNGHPCHGYEYNSEGAKTQTWIGDDCKIMVQSTTDTANGKTTMTLVSIGGAPSAEAFKVPSDYKVMGQ
jgi:hypothetical protein